MGGRQLWEATLASAAGVRIVTVVLVLIVEHRPGLTEVRFCLHLLVVVGNRSHFSGIEEPGRLYFFCVIMCHVIYTYKYQGIFASLVRAPNFSAFEYKLRTLFHLTVAWPQHRMGSIYSESPGGGLGAAPCRVLTLRGPSDGVVRH